MGVSSYIEILYTYCRTKSLKMCKILSLLGEVFIFTNRAENEEDASFQSTLEHKLGRIGYEACPGDGLLDCEYIQPAFIPLVGFRGIAVCSIFGLVGLCQFLPQFLGRFLSWLGGSFKDDHLVPAFKVQRDVRILHDIARMPRLGLPS